MDGLKNAAKQKRQCLYLRDEEVQPKNTIICTTAKRAK